MATKTNNKAGYKLGDKVGNKTGESTKAATNNEFVVKLFIIGMVLYATSCLYLRTYNNSLTMQVQDIQREISELKLANATLNSEIQEIISKAKIYEVAEENSLTQNLDNVYSIVNP